MKTGALRRARFILFNLPCDDSRCRFESAQDRPASCCWNGILFCGSLAAEHFARRIRWCGSPAVGFDRWRM